MEDKDKLDKAIEQAIRQVGKERDAEDLATLKSFMAKRQQKSKAKKFIMSITSIAAIIAIVFSLNIYQGLSNIQPSGLPSALSHASR